MTPDDRSPAQRASLIEQMMVERQALEPLELLLEVGALSYPDYESWRLGRRAELQGALSLPLGEVLELLQQAAEQARAFGFQAEQTRHRRWGDADPAGIGTALQIGPDAGLCRLLGTRFVPPPRDRQLDLFYDSGSVAIEQSLRQALAERRLADARSACARLLESGRSERDLGDWLRLIAALDAAIESTTVSPAEQLREIDALTPIAERLLGQAGARDVLAVLWDDLARLTDGLAFDPRSPRLHPGWALARLGRWEQVRAAVEAESDWHDRPQLVAQHATACGRCGDRPAALSDWLGLCWTHPEAAEAQLDGRDFPDAELAACWSAFSDLERPADAPALETEDFPSWCLIAVPGLAALAPAEPRSVDEDRATAYRAARALAQSPDDLRQRRALGAAHPGLLAALLARRGTAS